MARGSLLGRALPVSASLLHLGCPGELFALLLRHRDEQSIPTEAAGAINASFKTVDIANIRLVDAGLVRDTRRGNVGMLQAEPTTISRGALTDR